MDANSNLDAKDSTKKVVSYERICMVAFILGAIYLGICTGLFLADSAAILENIK